MKYHKKFYFSRAAFFYCIMELYGVTSAVAQQNESGIAASIPVDRFVKSIGGVDLRSGAYIYEKTDLSIGMIGEEKGLSFTRFSDSKLHKERLAQFSHNWEIYVLEQGLGAYGAGATSTTQIEITAAGRSNTFRTTKSTNQYGSMGASVNPSYAQLERVQVGSTYRYRYTADDGTIINFSTRNSASCGDRYRISTYASDITLPNGIRYDLTYDNIGTSNTRLRKVTSNTGYALLFEYIVGSGGRPFIAKACALNLAYAPSPTNGMCPIGAMSTTYQYTGDFLSQVTDSSGAQWQFTTTYTDDVTPYTMSFFNPSSNIPSLINTYYQNSIDAYDREVTRQIFRAVSQ